MQKLNDLASNQAPTFSVGARNLYSSGYAEGQVIQCGSGRDEGLVECIKIENSHLLKVRFDPTALIRTAQDKEYVNFTVPLLPSDTWVMNSVKLSKNTFCINLFSDENELLATRRNSFCGRVPLVRFQEILYDLTGRHIEENGPLARLCRLSSEEYAGFLQTLSGLFAARQHEATGPLSESSLTELLARAVALSSVNECCDTFGILNCRAIVRRAREISEARQPNKTKIAELCRAVGVSAPVLIAAFRDVTGTTPSKFFALERLERARAQITRSRPVRGAIKSAALQAGFNELGRFSSFYKQVYGELPSETNLRLLTNKRSH